MEARASPLAMAVRAASTATVLDVMRRSAFDGNREAPGAVSVAWLATAYRIDARRGVKGYSGQFEPCIRATRLRTSGTA
jgi:hypothetical protein